MVGTHRGERVKTEREDPHMPRYVTLLRAINVGGRNVKMAHLRDLFGLLGFARK